MTVDVPINVGQGTKSETFVRYLPKWAWALVIVLSIPIGGVAYLLVGREPA